MNCLLHLAVMVYNDVIRTYIYQIKGGTVHHVAVTNPATQTVYHTLALRNLLATDSLVQRS